MHSDRVHDGAHAPCAGLSRASQERDQTNPFLAVETDDAEKLPSRRSHRAKSRIGRGVFDMRYETGVRTRSRVPSRKPDRRHEHRRSSDGQLGGTVHPQPACPATLAPQSTTGRRRLSGLARRRGASPIPTRHRRAGSAHFAGARQFAALRVRAERCRAALGRHAVVEREVGAGAAHGARRRRQRRLGRSERRLSRHRPGA